MNLQERQQLLLERVMERIDFSGEISDGMVLDLIDDEMAGRTPGVPFQDRLRMRQEIFHSIDPKAGHPAGSSGGSRNHRNHD